MAAELGITPEQVVGCLIRVWSWANQQCADGNAPSVTISVLERSANVPGFAQAMQNVGWLVVNNGNLSFPNWDYWNSQSSKQRLLTNRRKGNWRAKKGTRTERSQRSPSVPREEKRREEKKKETPLRPLFDLFWQAYPPRNGKRLGKVSASKLFQKLSQADQEAASKAASNYAASKAAGDGYAKDPERFLKADFWKDWLEPEVSNGRATPSRSDYTGEGLGG